MRSTFATLLFLVLLGFGTSASAQTAPTSASTEPTTKTTRQANRKAIKYKSPVVVENTEELGRKIQRVSRPDNHPVPIQPKKK
ncbi:hypothetical protein [Hymenobacter crusticola]|nr:hypothetical protein [Hymenobacter crusticola]